VKFSVVLVDSRPAYEAKNLLKLLSGVGINCTYILLTAIGPILRTVNLVLLGAHAMLANGAIYGRAGTAMIAMISKTYGIPVVCCCETYKFSERVMLDSIVSNEISKCLRPLRPAFTV
jgi:translation initiation factor eIF-2B subunit delta